MRRCLRQSALGGCGEALRRRDPCPSARAAPAISGPAVAAGQGQPQRMEQLAALPAGRRLQASVSLARARPTSRAFAAMPRVLDQQALVVASSGGSISPCEDRQPVGEIRQMREIAAEQQPVLLGRAAGQAVGDVAKSSWWSSRALSSSTSCGSKWAGARPKCEKSKSLGQLVEDWRSARPAATCRSAPAATAGPSARGRPRAMLDAVRAEPLRQFALGGDQQRLMRELRAARRPAPRTSASGRRCSRHGPRRARCG